MNRGSLHRLMRRKSTIAFLMTLPLLTLIAVLVAYPAGYAIYLSMLDRKMTKFLGLANYFRKFIPNFSRLAAPLYHLTKKGEAFQVGEEMHECFRLIKQRSLDFMFINSAPDELSLLTLHAA